MFCRLFWLKFFNYYNLLLRLTNWLIIELKVCIKPKVSPLGSYCMLKYFSQILHNVFFFSLHVLLLCPLSVSYMATCKNKKMFI